MEKQEKTATYSPEVKKQIDHWMARMPEYDKSVGCCTYMLHYGFRYIINRGKTLDGSLFHFFRALSFFIAKNHKAADHRSDYFYLAFDYIRKHPDFEFRLDVLSTSEDPLELLEVEQNELNKAFSNKQCLNNNIIPYIPKEKEGVFGWMAADRVNLFLQRQQEGFYD